MSAEEQKINSTPENAEIQVAPKLYLSEEIIKDYLNKLVRETSFYSGEIPKLNQDDINNINISFKSYIDKSKDLSAIDITPNIIKTLLESKDENQIILEKLIRKAVLKRFSDQLMRGVYISKKKMQIEFNKAISSVNYYSGKVPDIQNTDVEKFNKFYKEAYFYEKDDIKNDADILSKAIKMHYSDFIVNNIKIPTELYERLFQDCDNYINYEIAKLAEDFKKGNVLLFEEYAKEEPLEPKMEKETNEDFEQRVEGAKLGKWLKIFDISKVNDDTQFIEKWKAAIMVMRKRELNDTDTEIMLYARHLYEYGKSIFDNYMMIRLAYIAYRCKKDTSYTQATININCMLKFEQIMFIIAFGEYMANDLISYRANKYYALKESIKKKPQIVSLPKEMTEEDKAKVLNNFETTDLNKLLNGVEDKSNIVITEDALKDL